MTCREFSDTAASLTLWEFSRAQNQQLLRHADECSACGAWLRQRRMLAAGLQALQARTSSLEAGPNVERALLRTFRQATPKAVQPTTATAPRFTPIALWPTGFRQMGAYAAVAAAIVVALFLGGRLLQHHAGPAVQSQSSAASTSPALPSATAPAGESKYVIQAATAGSRISPTVVVAPGHPARPETQLQPSAAVEESSSDQDYIALMLCDPLSCSSDAQLVRMELPSATGGGDAQPQMADVVVGYDGLVRAVRIVN